MRKKLLVVVLALVCLALLFAQTLSAPKTGSLMLWTGYPECAPVYKAAAADYMKANPGVKVEVTAFDLRQSEQKYAISLPAGTTPDLYAAGHQVVHTWISDGFIEPIPAKQLPWLKRSFDQVYLDTFSQNGKYYGVPEVHGFQVLYYNLDHYKEAGLTKPPKDLDELMAHARKLAKYDNNGKLTRAGITLRLSGGGMGVAQKFENFLFPNGGSVLEPTGFKKWKANFANEAGFKALNFHLQAVHKYKVDSYDVKHDSEAFVLGVASMLNRETFVIGEAKKRSPNMNYGVAQIVGGPVQHATNLNLNGWIIPKSCRNKELAWDFLLFMNRNQYAVQMMRDTGWIWTLKNVNYSSVYKVEPHFQQALDRPRNFKLIPAAPAVSFNEAYTRLSERLVQAYADPSLVDNRDKIMAVLKSAAQEVNDILKSNNEYGE